MPTMSCKIQSTDGLRRVEWFGNMGNISALFDVLLMNYIIGAMQYGAPPCTRAITPGAG